MALINCRECNKEISEFALECPQCKTKNTKDKKDETREQNNVEKPIQTIVQSKRKKKNYTWLMIMLLIIGISIGAYFVMDNISISNSSSPNKSHSGSSDSKNSTSISYESKDPSKEDLKKKKIRENLGEYVKLSMNNYKQKILGGIKNLRVTITNNSDYPIKNINVDVKVYKMNDKLYTTKYLNFKNIPANGQQVLSVPETAFGTYVRCQVTKINAPALN